MTINTWPGWQNAGLIGEGSFGKVFRIRREEFGRAYEAALKVITIPQNDADIRAAYEEGMDDKSVTEYFRSCVEDIVAEFALMSQLKGNSNIVSYEDHMVVQHEDGIGWDILIRMELLTPLMTYIRNHPLEEDDVVRLGIDIARALKLCRKKGILHRDIKPENIFVSDDGDFKLGDFGVARVAEKTVSAMSKKGTYTYMAPEVYKGEKYGFAADLYSLGMVLYRYLNDNRLPYMPPAPQPIQFRDRERALNARVMGQPMPEPAHGSAALKVAVMKACAYAQADRFASPEELEQALIALQKPVKKAAPVEEDPAEDFMPYQPAESSWKQNSWKSEPQEAEDDDDDWEDDDDFEKTVSSLDMRKPVKKAAPVEEEPAEDFVAYEPAEPAWKQDSWKQSGWNPASQEDDDDDWDDEDDFDKTVSTFSARKPAKKVAQPEPEPEEFFEDEDEDDDEFDRTVSAFSARPMKGAAKSSKPIVTPKPMDVPKPAKKEEKTVVEKKAKEPEKPEKKGLFAKLFGGKKK